MASFVYNIYNSTKEPVIKTNIYYQFYHVNTKRLSDIRESIDNQVSFDSDDADINNQEAPFKSGDIGLLIMWKGNIDRLDPDILLDIFGILKIDGDGSDVYTDDIYLFGSQIPTGNIFLSNESNIKVNDNVYINTYSSDDYQVNNLYQKNSWYGIKIFPQVKINNISYDFGEGYQSNNSFIYEKSGEYNISVKFTNKYNQEFIKTKNIKIYNEIPVISLSCDPISPYKDDIYTLSVDILNDQNITEIKYYMDNIVIDDLGGFFSEIDDHIFKTIVTYNNGFEEDVVLKTLVIHMSTLKPNITLNLEKSDDIYKGISTIERTDGEITEVEYKIQFQLPFKNIYEHVLTKIITIDKNTLYNEDGKDYYKNEIDLLFNNTGVYKVTAKIIDNYNNEATSEKNINIDCNESNNIINQQITMLFDQE